MLKQSPDYNQEQITQLISNLGVVFVSHDPPVNYDSLQESRALSPQNA
jgi:hypothetical protein